MTKKLFPFAAAAAFVVYASAPAWAANINTINNVATITIANNGDFNANYAIKAAGTAASRTITFNIINSYKPISNFDIELAETGNGRSGLTSIF